MRTHAYARYKWALQLMFELQCDICARHIRTRTRARAHLHTRAHAHTHLHARMGTCRCADRAFSHGEMGMERVFAVTDTIGKPSNRARPRNAVAYIMISIMIVIWMIEDKRNHNIAS